MSIRQKMLNWYLVWFKRIRKFFSDRLGHRDSKLRWSIRWLDRFMTRIFFPNPFPTGSWQIHWRPNVWGIVRELAAGVYEPYTRTLFADNIHPDMTIIDAGANFGLYTLLAASKVGSKGSIYSFEPNPTVFPLLKKNIITNGYANFVHAEPLAITNRCGTAELSVGRFSSVGGHIASQSIGQSGDNDLDRFQVQTTTLDQFFQERGWPRVDVVKMDIEGHEQYALEGMTELNSRNPQLQLFLEIGTELLLRAGTSPEAFMATLKGLGFRKFFVTECPTPLRLDLPRELSKLLEMIPSDGSQMLWCLKQ